ncbi:MAG: PAS domain S-box protein, partial [Deltaproteobacteria bacterium]
QQWAEMHGYSIDELEPHISTWGKLVHPEDQSQILEAFNAHLENRARMYETVQRHRCKSGEWIWVQSRGKVVERDENGRPTRRAGTTLNVTRRKQAEERLQQSEEQYRLVVENAREIIFVVQDRKIRFINRSGFEQLKYSEQEILSMSSLDLILPEDREMVDQNYVRRMQRESAPDRYTTRIVDREGRVLSHEITPVRVMWEGAPAVLVFGTDVTKRQRAEEALRESEQRLQLALEGADLGLWDWNFETGETFFSERSIEMLGYSVDETDHHISDWGRLVHPEDISGIRQSFNAHLEGRTPFYESEHRLRRKSGEWMWNLARAKVVARKPDGTPIRVTGINRDITEQKHAEKALRESEEFNRRLVETAPMGIIYLDANGVIEYANPASNRIFGVPEDQPTPLLGYNVFDLPLVAGQPHVRAYFEALMQGERQSDIEFSYRSPLTGQDYTLLGQGTPRLAADGSTTGVVVMYLDLTARKRAQDQLKESLEEKELLLREMHHRVKNNLQVMSSLISLQAGYVRDERYAQMFNDAESRIRAMGLVHEMLYQSENLNAIYSNEYIQQMMGHLFRHYGNRAGTITYKIDVEDIVIELDTAVPFGLMLGELISNSLKHAFPDGREGEIQISTRLVDGEMVELVTRDNGIGMPPEIDLNRTQSLGLRLVKVLAQQLAATVELDRESGTEFRIRFRACPQQARR